MEATPNQESEERPKPVLSERITGRHITDINALSEADVQRLERRNKGRERLQEIERVIIRLLHIEQQNGGNLRGTNERQNAATHLGVSVWTIDNYMDAYKSNPRIEAFVDRKRGRTPGGTFSPEQQAILAYYYINPEKRITDSAEMIGTVKGLEGTTYMQAVLQKYAPSPSHSDDAVRRFLRLLKKDNALAVTLARKGKRYVEAKILPARRNDPIWVNTRWQIDGRPLPIYIRHDGLVCTVTLLLIIDDLSQYPLRARLIPRQLRDEKGLPQRSDFTAADVGILLASAIYYTGVCPTTLYNDNGKQFVAMETLLADVSAENQALITMTLGIPRRPRSRGKIENNLKQFDTLLSDVRGNLVGKEGDFDAIRAARGRNDLLSLEDLQQKCDEFMEHLRDQPRRKGEKQTRRAIWMSPEGSRRAPPIRQLLYLVPDRKIRDTAIDYWHFDLDNQEHEPKLGNDEDLYRWMVAAARKEAVPLRAAKLDTGWKCDICLDRDDAYWCEGIEKTERYLAADVYPAMLGRVLARASKEHATWLGHLTTEVAKTGVDRVYKHDISKEPITITPGTPHQQVTPLASANATPTPDNKESLPSPSQSTVSVRTAAARKGPEPVHKKFDWNTTPNIDETLARIERALRQERDDA